MKALFVAPMQRSTGEAATVVSMARELIEESCEVRVLASAELTPSIRARLPVDVRAFGSVATDNEALWLRTFDDFAPSHVIFADYPMLSFSSGVAPLRSSAWVQRLDPSDATLLTLDHLGYGQRAVSLYFGPPHLCAHPQRIPELPATMGRLLPCPIHEPGPVPGRRGVPFRVRGPQPPSPDARERARARLGIDGEAMILHTVSAWTRDFCDAYGIAYYELLPRLLGWYFEGAPQPVVLVSVNDGHTLPLEAPGSVRVVNLGAVDEATFGELVAGCDLFLNENPFSSTLGRVVCAGVPAACLVNSSTLVEIHRAAPERLVELALALEHERLGSVFPYRVLPLDFREELEALGLFRGNRFGLAFEELEVWGGEATRERLWHLLWSETARERLRERQRAYRDALEGLPGARAALESRCQ